ncbi:MAG: hypothetical protein JWO95_3293 [Verrucomicrobiales bacterium]|nr:hypothetical protein [Verrucomicrobiales bacterium]
MNMAGMLLGKDRQTICAIALLVLGCSSVGAVSTFDVIGVTALRSQDPSLNGTGVIMNHPEGSETGDTQFEVNPSTVGQPTSLFTWIGNNGATSTTYPNSLGTGSAHATGVATRLYSVNEGVVPNVSHVYNYLAWAFYSNMVVTGVAITGKIVNQSFATYGTPPDSIVASAYDNYVARYGTIFCSATGTGQAVREPAGAYNTIGVGVSDAESSVGGTPDGRAKPDLSAPGLATSFSTAYVTAAATILFQAAQRGDAGTNISAASDVRTIKALLMNGAIKPTNWTHTSTMPVDATHGTGAGVLNVFNSYRQMTSGQHRAIEVTSVTSGAAHPPGSNVGNEPALSGWDLATTTTSATQDTVAHYYFDLPSNNRAYVLTSTLAWNRALNTTSINNLDVFLFRISDGSQNATSVSTVDNVEHIYLSGLAPGRYDLQVHKHGGAGAVSNSETYALAFEVFALPLNFSHQGSAVVVTWPVYPSGFSLETTAGLSAPVSWSPVSAVPIISNGFYRVSFTSSNPSAFYRLRR